MNMAKVLKPWLLSTPLVGFPKHECTESAANCSAGEPALSARLFILLTKTGLGKLWLGHCILIRHHDTKILDIDVTNPTDRSLCIKQTRRSRSSCEYCILLEQWDTLYIYIYCFYPGEKDWPRQACVSKGNFIAKFTQIAKHVNNPHRLLYRSNRICSLISAEHPGALNWVKAIKKQIIRTAQHASKPHSSDFEQCANDKLHWTRENKITLG